MEEESLTTKEVHHTREREREEVPELFRTSYARIDVGVPMNSMSFSAPLLTPLPDILSSSPSCEGRGFRHPTASDFIVWFMFRNVLLLLETVKLL